MRHAYKEHCMSNATETPYVVVPRLSEEISVKMPSDAVHQLELIASEKEMSLQALVRFYIGQGLRQDISRRFSEQVLNKTREVLTQHNISEEELTAIIREIKSEFTPPILAQTK